ncbi:MAG TPA: hypothetical protein VFB26_01660 [Gaiellaceae bacterium]|nr:hypothetical protein [Gaiellaceae bacterium]
MATTARRTAVAVEMSFGGATLAQYDQILEQMGLSPGGAVPRGAISHWVAKTDDGLRVVDVWETKEQFDRFAREKIGPLSKQAGIEHEPTIHVYDVHNYLTAR